MTASPRTETSSSRPARPAMAMKWLVVLASLAMATVIDGIAISDSGKASLVAVSSSEQAAITLPSDRCGPGCAIMVASNLSGDAFSARSQ